MSYKMVGATIVIAALAIALTFGGKVHRVKLLGSGSSFIYPQMSAWIPEFRKRNPWVTLNYNPTGSGTGQQQFFDGLVDFAASDPPLSKEKWESYRGKVIQMPIVLGAVAVVYNVPELESGLRLDGETLALIYRGEVSYWDDPRLVELNPGVKLPHERIVAVHRSDSSGTTQVFTTFLHLSAPHVWPESLVGKTVEWPVDSKGFGVGSKGNQGVAQTLENTPYSVGYVELSYAMERGMKMAKIRNREGEFVLPTRESVLIAAKNAFSQLPKSPLDDFSQDLRAIVYAPGKGSYPITSFVHLVFWTEYDAEKVRAVSRLIEFLNVEGQEMIVRGYAPIPAEIRKVNLKALELLRVKP